jgi:hypothetical protein
MLQLVGQHVVACRVLPSKSFSLHTSSILLEVLTENQPLA